MSTAAAIATAAGVAHAQTASPPPPPPPPAQSQPAQDEEIVVLAPRGDEVRIDRKTYLIANDPIAQSTNMFDVLGRIPQVNVAPSGTITLLGQQNVTVWINGQPVPGGNPEQALRSLQGSEVERIEVITNPGAQYSSQTSGGIINIITRTTFSTGLTGALNAVVDSFGGSQLTASPTWSRGPWTFGGRINATEFRNSSTYQRTRQELLSGNVATDDGDSDSEGSFLSGGVQLAYRPDDKHRANLTINAGHGTFDTNQSLLRTGPGGPLTDDDTLFGSDSTSRGLNFDFQRTGAQPRELLKFNISMFEYDNDDATTITVRPTAGAPSQFVSGQSGDNRNFTSRLDFEHPMRVERFLTVGASFNATNEDFRTTQQTLIGPPNPADGVFTRYGVTQTEAAYATFQFTTGDWTWLPGLRAENYRREIVSIGAETDTSDLRWFPSIHVRRELMDGLNLDVSYSSRIQRPGLQALDPAIRFVDATHANTGNPNLRPTTVDAYEAALIYQHSQSMVGLTFFDRVNHDIQSSFTTEAGGVTLQSWTNAGDSDSRGLSAQFRAPIGGGWQYTLSANLLNREFDALRGGVLQHRSEFEYDGNGTLEYRDTNQSEIGADNLQFRIDFAGPREDLQTESDLYFNASFSWRRRLTDRLFAFLQVRDIFDTADSNSVTTTDTFIERYDTDRRGQQVRFTLTYQLGANAANRPPPNADSGGGGPPQQ